MSLYRSMRSPKTKAQIARELATDAIEDYREERRRQMQAHGSDAPETPKGMELLTRLSVLMKGPHGVHVKPIVFKAFPELEPPKGTA